MPRNASAPVSSNQNALDVSETPAAIAARTTNCTVNVAATNAEAARKPTTNPTPIPADGSSLGSGVSLVTHQCLRHNNHTSRESFDPRSCRELFDLPSGRESFDLPSGTKLFDLSSGREL